MNQKFFAAAVVVLVVQNSALAQLPPRPVPGVVEEPVASDIALKVDGYFEQYIANYKLINRFVGVASLDRTWKRKNEPLHVDLMWFIHAQDFEQHVRRMDELVSTLGPMRNGVQRPGVLKLATIETDKGAFQFHTHNATRAAQRDDFKEKEEDFGRKFRIQTRLDFWELPFSGSFDVMVQGTYPKVVWRAEPRAPALFQERGRVTAWHDNLTHAYARVVFDSGFGYDFTFAKQYGNMPIRVVLSRNDERKRGVTSVVDTDWFIYREPKIKQPIYLPNRVNCEFGINSNNGLDTHELDIHWLLGTDVSEFIFSQESDLFMDPLEIKELVLTKAINRD